MGMTRRQFLSSSSTAALVAGTMARGTVFGANERVRVACIGLRGRGGSHIGAFTKSPDAELVALCDVDEVVLDRRAGEVKDATGKEPKLYTDIRDVLADDAVDAITIAMPNHWHSLATIWGCQAGKDVFCEKPLSHNVFEGRQAMAAAKKHNRIVAHGTQRRSEKKWRRAMQRMREGVIGDIYMARGLCFKRRDSIGFHESTPPPSHLHWDLWQGPAQEQQYNPNYVHYNWHWFWEYGNGDIGNQGVHQMDVAAWGLDKGLPSRVVSLGGRYGYEDQATTANTQVTTFQYDDGALLVFEVRGRASNTEQDVGIGNLFYGSDGYMAEGTFYDAAGEVIPDDNPEAVDDLAGNHYQNFLNAVKSRNEADLTATVAHGHVSSALCHMANASYRIGAELHFDNATEKFIGAHADEANKLITRDYRAPFVVETIA